VQRGPALNRITKYIGSAMHQLNPLTMVATEGDSREREDQPHYYGDDHLWAVLAVTAYLKETGDLAAGAESLFIANQLSTSKAKSTSTANRGR